MQLLSSKEISRLAHSEKDARKRMRLLAICHFMDGKNRTEVAAILKVSRRSVNDWVRNYLSQGLDGLNTGKSTGRPTLLNKEQEKRLIIYIQRMSESEQGGRLTGADIIDYIKETFDIEYHPGSVYKLLHRLGFSWITSRSRHPQQSQQVQENFKKTPC